MPASRTFLQGASSATDASSYTFSSQSLGAADADRRIFVCVGSRKTGGATSISSVTVGGISASIEVEEQNTGTNTCIAAVVVASVPTGTTGDVVVTFADTMLRCGISMYRVLGVDGAAPFQALNSTADPGTANLDIPADGFAISVDSVVCLSVAWTNLTEDTELNIESNFRLSTASDEFASQQTDRTITTTRTGTVIEPISLYASWSPDGATGLAASLLSALTQTDTHDPPRLLTRKLLGNRTG